MKFLKLALVVSLLAPLHTASARPAPVLRWPAVERPLEEGVELEPCTTGVRVRTIQYLLRAHGQKVKVDGIYGWQTTGAVVDFQSRNGFPATGNMTDATWEALIVPSEMGSNGDGVRALQSLLQWSEYILPVDGNFGPVTRAAVVKFQKENGLAPDGFVGKQTWRALTDGRSVSNSSSN